ncbi:DUF4167 domain-containing protein [Muricoccus radiodurans]|uniref:DUF4167 domain-containing protein n=1 Tax=Muricoccus radiodurans TaxID=2231721 RepID=UPI003CE9E2B8
MNMKRMRGRGNYRQGGHGGGGGGHGGGGGGGPRHNTSHQPMNRNHVFDSIGPDMRMRGTAQQLFEKYLQLGRDATSSGDRVMAEGYFQHAEHYFRILGAMNQAQQGQGGGNYPQGGQQRRYQQDGQGGENGYGGEAEVEGAVNGHGGPDVGSMDAEPQAGDAREVIQ